MDLAVAIAAGVIGAPALLTAVNVAQNYVGAGPGTTLDEILQKPADAASVDDLIGLNKARLRRLFAAARPPTPGALVGEYRARLLAGGVMGPASRLYTHKAFGPGTWVGKGFPPPGEPPVGYNLFATAAAGTARVRRMALTLGPSQIVSGDAMLVDYKPFNGGTVATMRDEIRQINAGLFIGMGYMAIGGGSINPAPFALAGPATPWQGADESAARP